MSSKKVDDEVAIRKREERKNKLAAYKAGKIIVEVHVKCNTEIERNPATGEPFCSFCNEYNVTYKKLNAANSNVIFLEDIEGNGS